MSGAPVGHEGRKEGERALWTGLPAMGIPCLMQTCAAGYSPSGVISMHVAQEASCGCEKYHQPASVREHHGT
jgi:hypothetical protein